MSSTVSVWLVIAAALVGANVPFLNQRVLAVGPARAPKGFALRLAELVLMYFLVGALGLALENAAGQIAPQGWEFYAVTGALFITLAFPGFVWQYLWSRTRA